jgi:hypothetical protein
MFYLLKYNIIHFSIIYYSLLPIDGNFFRTALKQIAAGTGVQTDLNSVRRTPAIALFFRLTLRPLTVFVWIAAGVRIGGRGGVSVRIGSRGGVTASTTLVSKPIHPAHRLVPFRSVVAVAALDSPVVRLTPCPPTVVDCKLHLRLVVRRTTVILRTAVAFLHIFLCSIVLIASDHGPRARLAPSPPTFVICNKLKTKTSFYPKHLLQHINYLANILETL